MEQILCCSLSQKKGNWTTSCTDCDLSRRICAPYWRNLCEGTDSLQTWAWLITSSENPKPSSMLWKHPRVLNSLSRRSLMSQKIKNIHFFSPARRYFNSKHSYLISLGAKTQTFCGNVLWAVLVFEIYFFHAFILNPALWHKKSIISCIRGRAHHEIIMEKEWEAVTDSSRHEKGMSELLAVNGCLFQQHWRALFGIFQHHCPLCPALATQWHFVCWKGWCQRWKRS